MDPRLIDLYEAELEYLKAQSKTFAESHESAARRLGLNSSDPDPYVERLLEGVAFLSSRVHLKMKDQFPEFTQHLLQAVQPHYLAPTPSICIAAFEPEEGDPGLVTGFSIAKKTSLAAPPPGETRTPVTFRTGHDVTLWPLTIKSAEYISSRAAAAKFAVSAGVRAQAALKLRIEPMLGCDLKAVEADELDVYLDGSEAVPNELYRQILGDCVAVVARAVDSQEERFVTLEKPEQKGFDAEDALLPNDGRSLAGYRTLTEYFACPERFRFIRLKDLQKAFALSSGAVEITLLFNRSSKILEQSVSERNFRLFATPAINLFEKRLNRVPVKHYEQDFKVVADRDAPLDFEVFRLLDVKAYDRDNTDPRVVAPLYAFGSNLFDYRSAIYYTTSIRTRRLSKKETRLRRRKDYIGTDVYISLTSPGDADRLNDINDLAIRALVTNRELPEMLEFSGDQHLNAAGIPARIKVVRAPTRPLPPLGIGDAAWRLIGHLTPNYATLVPEEGGDGELLRNHLALYGRPDDPVMRSQIDGITSARSRHITRRVPGLGRMAMARGLRIDIELDDSAFDQASLFLFSAVIDRFLTGFSIVNSFVETHFRTKLQGEIAAWPPRIGRRQVI